MKLTFEALSIANMRRIPEFKNSRDEYAHHIPDGSNWDAAQWLQAVIGELGEYASFRKKYERGDIDLETFKREAAKELADTVCYLDILAQQLDIDLGSAIVEKFNEISERIGSQVLLDEELIMELDDFYVPESGTSLFKYKRFTVKHLHRREGGWIKIIVAGGREVEGKLVDFYNTKLTINGGNGEENEFYGIPDQEFLYKDILFISGELNEPHLPKPRKVPKPI